MQGIQIKIEKREVDTKGKSFIIEATERELGQKAYRAISEGMSPSEQYQAIVEEHMYLPYVVPGVEGEKETVYFVKIDDRRLFADLTKISEEAFNKRMDKAFADGERQCRLSEMPRALEQARYQAADNMQHWFAHLPWYRRLFYSPAPLVEAANTEIVERKLAGADDLDD